MKGGVEFILEKMNYHFIAGDHDNPSPQEPPGQGSSSPPSSVVDDNPAPAAQATPSCASTIAIRILSYI